MIERAKEILFDALGQPPERRQEFVDHSCAGNDALRARVMALLEAYRDAGHFLAAPTVISPVERDDRRASLAGTVSQTPFSPAACGRSSLPISDNSTHDLDIGAEVGPYHLIERLGEGGFGVVFHAEQRRPVRRDVALKLVRPEMQSPRFLARFEAERQTLAMMDHPHIARVFDAGQTEDGRPYFVMELVRGEPITRFCDARALALRERLRLFRDTCLAVQHAHTKGIIHRDLKPNNVLVTTLDGLPVPKVIDFGVAKALGPPLTERTVLTEARQFIGTPQYMSPEQASGGLDDVDARSDIYSLGVLLYELLTGTTPIDPERLSGASLFEMQRLVRDEDPPKPSVALSRLGDVAPVAAQRRGTDANQLRRLLRGELDWIVCKALEKDRARRYATASALAQDIDHYLYGRPVDAAPPSTWYRTMKLVRRHRAATAAALAMALALVVALGGTTAGLVIARRAEREARTQAQIAQAVNEFLNNDLLASVAPSNEPGAGRDVRMRQVLDAAAARIDAAAKPGGRFAGTPLVEAAIRQTLGWTYLELGLYPEAQRHLERSLALHRGSQGDDAAETAAAMSNLAQLHLRTGALDRAEELLDRAIAVQRAHLDQHHPLLVESIRRLASLKRRQGDYARAEALYEQALEAMVRRVGRDDPDVATLLNGLAIVKSLAGKDDEAEKLFREVVEIQTRVLGPDNPSTLVSRNNLAAFYRRAGRAEQAEPLLRQTLEVQRRLLGPEHPDTLAAAHNLADTLRALRRFDEAEKLFLQTLELDRRVRGETHIQTLATMANLARTYQDQALHDRAVPLLKTVIDAAMRTLGPEHPQTANWLTDLATTYMAEEREAEAVPLLERVLAQRRAQFGDGHPQTIQALLNLATMFRRLEQFDRAEPMLIEAQRTALARLGERHALIVNIESDLCELRVDQSRFEEADEHGRRAVVLARQLLPPHDPELGKALVRHGQALTALKRFDQAETALLEGFEILRGTFGPDHRHTRFTIRRIADLYDARGQRDRSEQWRSKLPTTQGE